VKLVASTALRELDKAIERLPSYPDDKSGRGIVIATGGPKYFPCAWVCVSMLRHHGCRLPIQFWHLGPSEAEPWMRQATARFGVEWIDAREVARTHPARILNGWELKPYSILHSSFREVLSLDSDNVPVRDPSYLFETPEYEDTGAVFWPDFGKLSAAANIWKLTGIAYRDEPEFESGQVLVDKARRYKELSLTMWFNEHSDFWYQHFLGDKETFHLAWRKLGTRYQMPSRGIHHVGRHTMCQHDFSGARVFQHRNLDKWRLDGTNQRNSDFLFEEQCRAALATLREIRDEREPGQEDELCAAMQELSRSFWYYERVGYDGRFLELQPRGYVGRGAAECEQTWDFDREHEAITLHGERPTCTLKRDGSHYFRGRWFEHERMPVTLVRLRVHGSRDRARFSDVWQHDPYGLRALREVWPRLARFVVVGASTLAVPTWIKHLWPHASVLALERDANRLPELRECAENWPNLTITQATLACDEPGALPAHAVDGASWSELGELIERECAAPPEYIHFDCGALTASVIERAARLGSLREVAFIGGECRSDDERERIHLALATTHAWNAPENPANVAAFLAQKKRD